MDLGSLPHLRDTPWVLALDIGTSSSRAIVFDALGNAVPGLRHQVEYEPDAAEPGQSTFDAVALRNSAIQCIDGALERAGIQASKIAAVGVTTFWHSMAGVGRDSRAATPLFTWADTRSAEAARELRERLDPDAYHERTGCAIHPSYFPARLEWWRDKDPASFAQVDRWMSPGEFLFLELFGDAACSFSMASGTGLLNQNLCEWDSRTLEAIGLPSDRLCRLVDIDQGVSGLRREYAIRWPALARVPWSTAIGDGAASNLGSGCSTESRIAINMGTSGAIRVLFPAQTVIIPPELWCYRLDRAHFVLGGAFSDGGSAAAWVREAFRSGSLSALMGDVEAMEPDVHGLTILPFLSGERSTGWRPDARATLHGFSSQTRAADIQRAMLEAVALRFSLVYGHLSARFPNAEDIIAGGGAFKAAPFWVQILADAIGAPIRLSEETEATSRGAAAVALCLAGVLKDFESFPTPKTSAYEPDPIRHAIYRRALARQEKLYAAVSEM